MERLRGFVSACVSSWTNLALSGLALAVAAKLAIDLCQWAIVHAAWTASSGRDCPPDGACWGFIRERWDLVLYGPYPAAERWRVIVTGLAGLLGLGLLMSPLARHKGRLAAALLVAYPALAFALLRGGVIGLPLVPSAMWGGLMLTLVVAGATIVAAVPMGLGLALARRSKLPVVGAAAALYIDIMRGLPLIGILFVAIVMFPFFLPPNVEIEKLPRALAAFSLFNAAVLAEVFRGGLQSVPSGQSEAATALGLGHWRTTFLVVVPQAVAVSLPGVVNVCVSIIKETTLVLIVGLFDLLGVLQSGVSDPNWLTSDEVRRTGYFFAGVGFWIICFALSRYGARIERRLGPARR